MASLAQFMSRLKNPSLDPGQSAVGWVKCRHIAPKADPRKRVANNDGRNFLRQETLSEDITSLLTSQKSQLSLSYWRATILGSMIFLSS